MKRTHAILVAALLLSGTLAALAGFPHTVGAVDLTADPVTVRANSNVKESLSVSASDDGRIYIAWSERIDDMDVYYSYSSNNGTTFSPAARVNRDSAGSQTGSQVATANGNLYIVWEDGRLDGGDIILARSEDGGLTFDEVRVSDHEEGTQSTPSMASSGDRVAVSWKEERSDNTIRIWKGADGELFKEISGHQGAVRGAEFSPNGTYIASGSEDRTVKIWNATTGALLNNLSHHTREVTSVAWSPDGSILATGSWDYNVTLLDTTDFSEMTRLNTANGIPVKNFPNSVDFSPNGTLVAVGYNGQYGTGAPDGYPVTNYNLTVWNPDNGTSWTRNALNPLPDKGHTNSVMDVAFSRNGTYLASCSKDATVKIWNSSTGQQIRDMGLGNRVHSLSWSPDDAFLAAGLGNGSVALVNTSSWTVGWLKGTHSASVNSLDWGISGGEILSGASDPVAKVWFGKDSPYSGTERLSISGHINSVYSVDWSPDNHHIITAGGMSTQYGLGETQIFCAVSDDRGLTFSSPVMVADTSAGKRFSPDVAMDPAGNISVVWYDHRKGDSYIYFANSTDGGASFGRNVGIDTKNKDCVTPKIFVDRAGTAHVAWQHGERVGIVDIPGRVIRYANSTDGFAKSKIFMSGAHAQMPHVAGSPDGSSIWVSWRYMDPATNLYHINANISYDGGVTFMAAESLNYSSIMMDEHSIFTDRYNQTYVTWESHERSIYHLTTVLSDEWAPSIQSTTPGDGDTDVSIFTEFNIRFSEPMHRAVTEAAFSWTDGESTWDVGDCVGNTGTWNTYGDVVSFKPRTPLQYQKSTYSFSIASTASDLAGNLLGSNFTFSFTTSEDVDPPIIEHYPSQDTVSYDAEYTVMAIIRDQWGTVEEARLFYQGVGGASPDASVEMSSIGSDTYQAVIPAQNALGMIYYYIQATDAFNNRAWSPANYTNHTRLYNVSVVDMVKPEISHVPVTEADVFGDIEIWAVVTDSIQLQGAWLNYRPLGATAYTREAMQPVSATPNTFSQVIPAQDNIGMIHYNITALDASGNFNSTPSHSIQIIDRTAPLINSVIPELLDNQTRVRVLANVTDDVGVGSVTLYFKAVGGNQWVERSMNPVSNDTYEFVIPAQRRSGAIYYYVNATDTSGNTASTLFEQDEFQIEVVGVGPNNTLYYVLGGVLLILMVVLVYLVVRRFSGPDKSDYDDLPIEEEMPPEPEDAAPEGVDEAP